MGGGHQRGPCEQESGSWVRGRAGASPTITWCLVGVHLPHCRQAPLESAGSRGTVVVCVGERTRSAAGCCCRSLGAWRSPMLLHCRPAPLESAGSRGTSVMCVALRTRSAAACCWRCIHSRCCCRFRSSCCGRRWSAATLPTRVLLLTPGCRRCILSGWCFLVQISCSGDDLDRSRSPWHVCGEGCVRRVARASAARAAPV